ncbi:hypothetical protein BACPU_20910 [Bacillus pumilus]|nr:hypothetical protein BACPU_20910 [Bacillus pumilus]
MKPECHASFERKIGTFLQTPTLRSGGLKLSYLDYGICSFSLDESSHFPFWKMAFYVVKNTKLPGSHVNARMYVKIYKTNDREGIEC